MRGGEFRENGTPVLVAGVFVRGRLVISSLGSREFFDVCDAPQAGCLGLICALSGMLSAFGFE